MVSSKRSQSAASIEEKVAFLRRPEAYSARPPRVEVFETHMSWVFLTCDSVFKLKKPVRYAFLDFSTLAARHLDCRREVRLNRRLAPDVYRGIVPLVRRCDGGLALDGPGRVVDWLVEMRRLPGDRMLDALIRTCMLTRADVGSLARFLSAFYRRARPIAISAKRYVERLVADVRDNQAQLREPAYGLATARIDRLAALQLRFIKEQGGLLRERARGRRIIDAHGDLRPEHVCLTTPPRIIDCLEFNREFRLVDPVDELSYLAMECERGGDASVGVRVLARYRAATGDRAPAALIAFYKTFRAFLRARIAIAHIADHDVQDVKKWRRRANGYLRLATTYLSQRKRVRWPGRPSAPPLIAGAGRSGGSVSRTCRSPS